MSGSCTLTHRFSSREGRAVGRHEPELCQVPVGGWLGAGRETEEVEWLNLVGIGLAGVDLGEGSEQLG